MNEWAENSRISTDSEAESKQMMMSVRNPMQFNFSNALGSLNL